MTDTKPDIPQEMVEKAADGLAAMVAYSAGGKRQRAAMARVALEAAGVGELIADRNHAHREYALHKSLATDQVDSLIAELAEVKAARPSRETVDKLVEALREVRHHADDEAGFMVLVRAALLAYESETKR